ncbi:MAG: hypothetical protein J07HX64_00500 [halophilic archaeon J07HX64]|nr:MAG: hypothetical protein J07HX64_00500 [halophilic archaeon J07HX64]
MRRTGNDRSCADSIPSAATPTRWFRPTSGTRSWYVAYAASKAPVGSPGPALTQALARASVTSVNSADWRCR